MPVLVDTSVWVAHFRSSVPEVVALLNSEEVAIHPVVIGELAVGNLRKRSNTLAFLRQLLDLPECPTTVVLDFIEQHQLYGLGLSWGDVQLLATANLNNIPLWTLDSRLQDAATRLRLTWVK